MWKIYKKRSKNQKFKEPRDWQYIYHNEIDKACLQDNMADEDFKDLTRRTTSDKILHDVAFNIAKYPTYDDVELF